MQLNCPIIQSNVLTLSTPTTGEVVFGAKNNSLYMKNSSGDEFNLAPTKNYFLTSAFPSTSTTRANITGWSFSVEAGKSYTVEIIGGYQSVALTTGGSLGFVLSGGGVGTIAGYVSSLNTQATSTAINLKTGIRAVNAVNTTAGSFHTSSSVAVINSPHNIQSKVVFNCTTAGTFSVQWGSRINGSSAQLNAGSIMIITKLN
jgi:hypothetical protein